MGPYFSAIRMQFNFFFFQKQQVNPRPPNTFFCWIGSHLAFPMHLNNLHGNYIDTAAWIYPIKATHVSPAECVTQKLAR